MEPPPSPERIADGVRIVRGGFPAKMMNVYLIEEADGVTVFDAGIAAMTGAVATAAAGLGGIKRVVWAGHTAPIGGDVRAQLEPTAAA